MENRKWVSIFNNGEIFTAIVGKRKYISIDGINWVYKDSEKVEILFLEIERLNSALKSSKDSIENAGFITRLKYLFTETL